MLFYSFCCRLMNMHPLLSFVWASSSYAGKFRPYSMSAITSFHFSFTTDDGPFVEQSNGTTHPALGNLTLWRLICVRDCSAIFSDEQSALSIKRYYCVVVGNISPLMCRQRRNGWYVGDCWMHYYSVFEISAAVKLYSTESPSGANANAL